MTIQPEPASNRLHLDLATDDPSGAVRYADRFEELDADPRVTGRGPVVGIRRARVARTRACADGSDHPAAGPGIIGREI
jgi:hypothetical protein